MTGSDIENLWELQRLDLHCNKLRRRLEQPSRQVAHDEALALAKQELRRLKKAESRQEELTKLVRQGELEVATYQAQVKELEAVLYGGAITNSRDLAGMARKLAGVKAAQSKLEDELLVAMQELETVQQTATAARKRAKVLTRHYKEKQAELTEEITKVQQALDDYSQQRRDLAEYIAPDWLSRYEKLSRKLPDAVAKAEGNKCGACRLPLPSALVSQAAAQENPTYCEGCGRLLYVP